MPIANHWRRTWAWLLLPAAALVVAGLLVMPLPQLSRETKALGDLCHPLLFGGLAWLLHRLGPLPGMRSGWLQLGANLSLIVGFGWLTERMQAWTNRQPSWHDLAADLGGAVTMLAGLAAVRSWNQQRPTAALAAAAGALLAAATATFHPLGVLWDSRAARAQMPVLGDFESPWEITRWRFDNSDGQLAQGSAGGRVLAVKLLPGRYAAATLTPPVGDWASYQRLECRVELLGTAPLDVAVKIYDHQHADSDYAHDDRYQEQWRLMPGPNQIEISLAEVGRAPAQRQMDLSQIECFQLFTWDLRAPREVRIDELRLQ